MPRPVFISYARQASATHAEALAAKLGDLAFLDTTAIDDGDHFPQRLLDGLLDASIVVIFATQAYTESRFCRLEMRLALAGGDAAGSHLVLALGEAPGAVLEAMPTTVATQSWPPAEATDRIHGAGASPPAKPPAADSRQTHHARSPKAISGFPRRI